MTVGKTEIGTLIMAIGGHVPPLAVERRLRKSELGVVQRNFMFVDEDEKFRRRWVGDLRELFEARLALADRHAGVGIDHPTVGINGLAHVVATVSELLQFVAGIVFDGGAVRWTMVDADLGVVGKKEADFDVVGIGVGAGAAGTPGVLLGVVAIGAAAEVVNVGVRHQIVLVVAGIHLPAELELFEVVLTGDRQGSLFCAGQSWKEQSGKSRNNCDDDKQFDQREGVAILT